MVRKIVLSIAAVLTMCNFALAQNRQVTGTVTSTGGSPVIGANVVVEGTTIGTSTDVQGKYVLEAPANSKLSFSSIGYATQVVALNGRTQLDIVLAEAAQSLDDVIVTAYGEAKREAFTGSAVMVKTEDIVKSQTTNAIDALNGKVAGLQLINASGQPGSTPTLLIRGVSSIESGKNPLIIVDGMSFAGSINDINPVDIESMSVLKDAAAAALYGSRGANGVILITTHRAKQREAVINVDIKVGVNQRATQDYDFITDPGKYYETHYAAIHNYNLGLGMSADAAYHASNETLLKSTGGGLGYNVYKVPDGQSLIGRNGRLNPNATLGNVVSYNGEEYLLTPDNWTDEVYMNGIRQEYNVSAAAATDRSSFYGSFGYLNNEGIVANTGYERYTARLRADYQAKKWLKLGGNVSYAHGRTNSSTGEGSTNSTGNVFAFLPSMAPIYPLYIRDGKGNIRRDAFGNIMYDYGTATRNGSNAGIERPYMANGNAYADHLLNRHSTTFDTAAFNGFVDVILPKGFKVTVDGGVSMRHYDAIQTSNLFYGSSQGEGSLAKEQGTYWAYTLKQILTWTRQFGSHNVDVMVGHENNFESSTYVGGSKTGLFSNNSTEMSQVLKVVSASSGSSYYTNEGYFARAQYDYDNRLFFSASYRRDASSRFHPDHRWGNFWAVSAGWLLNRESWFNADWVDELKVKFSYGQQGNDQLSSSYYWTDLYSIKNDGTDNWSVSFAQKGNENITWETNANLNAGLDFSFWKGRLSGTVEYFNRMTSDMLSFYTVPSSMGYSGYWMNVGDMSNQGLEVSLNGSLLRKKNFSWDVNLNMTYVRNRITDLSEQSKSEVYYTKSGKAYRGYRDGSSFYGVGLPIYTMLLKSYAGVDGQTGEPLFWKREEFINSQGKQDFRLVTTKNYADEATYFLFDTSLPDLYGGFGTSFSFYGVDISFNFVYQIGGKVYDSGYAALMGSPSTSQGGSNYHKDIAQSWSPSNPNSALPRFVMGDQYTAASSDRFMTDASYLSLQNINVGYTLPRKITEKFGVSKLRFYLACENVWLWSQRQGLDPRQSYSGGSSTGYYSPIRTINGGINLTF